MKVVHLQSHLNILSDTANSQHVSLGPIFLFSLSLQVPASPLMNGLNVSHLGRCH